MQFVDEVLDASMLERWVRLERITADVVRLGVSRGYLSSLNAIHLMVRRMKAGVRLSATEVEVALLLSDEAERVPALLGEGARAGDDAARVWLYVGLKEVRERWGIVERPWDQVAELVEVAGRPEPWASFVYYDRVPLFRRPRGLNLLLVELDREISSCDVELGKRATM